METENKTTPEQEEVVNTTDPDAPDYTPEIATKYELEEVIQVLTDGTVIDVRGQIWQWTDVPVFQIPDSLPVCPKIEIAKEYGYRMSYYNGVSGIGIEKMMSDDISGIVKRWMYEHSHHCVHCCNQFYITLSHYDHIEHDRFKRWTKQWWKQRGVDTIVGAVLLYGLEKVKDRKR